MAVLPFISVGRALAVSCGAGKSMNVVAHEDDDLLFLNPAILHDIQNNRCVQTVFMTAGDAGSGSSYWGGRESGMKAAYAQMAGVSNVWDDTTPTILGHTAHLSTLHNAPQVSLLFLRLPDGGEHDGIEGFASDNYETMRKLWQGTIGTIHAVDGSASYAREELTDTLATQMALYEPGTIRSLDYTGTYSDLSGGDDDHWDHHSSAYFTQVAQAKHTVVSHMLTGYMGYPVDSQSTNISGTDLTNKQNAFYTYNAYDGGDCTSSSNCTAVLADYLQKQYAVGTQSGSNRWSYTTMEGDPGSLSGRNADVGNQPSTVVFGTNVYSFYYDATAGDLRYAKSSTSTTTPSWTFGILDGAGGSSGRLNTDLGLTPNSIVFNGVLHVFYYDPTSGNLRHGWTSDGVNWSFNNHDGDTGSIGGLNANLGKTPIATVYGSSLQLFYYDASNGNLRHSWSSDGSAWSFETLDGDSGAVSGYNANVGGDPSVTVYGSTLQLFYYDLTQGDLRHAWSDASGWHFETLDGSGGSSGRVSADVGITSTVAVQGSYLNVFYYDSSNGNLRHMWTSPTAGWQAENLIGDASSVVRYNGSIGAMPVAIANGSAMELFTYDASHQALIHLWDAGSGWQEESVDGFGADSAGTVGSNVGLDPSLVIYGSALHVIYYDAGQGNLRYAQLSI